jgi:hypothetical protein
MVARQGLAVVVFLATELASDPPVRLQHVSVTASTTSTSSSTF